ncbi:aldolase/citrate lyase family protein [Rhodococcus oxybenzonivorans]|uniref:HpcH/HpaI aldolase/citrate lyase family protein n=1 Tax=Rhodococcus TaxID=1827 RepID=UPI00131FD344|nr:MULTISPECIES: aldolase/citrate lyase family protein [Rhodococcus]MDV7352428.1 aldolase/citrate lyase family protein [Rhodococcus oxybenzonivorans]QHE72144.1 Citrate lyase beta chain [Rhodococcus sp. WAY2]
MKADMETTVAPRIAAEQARSWLLVPAGKPEGFEAAHASAADAVILDLEDAVTPDRKPRARADVVAWLGENRRAWVRINDATTPFWADDLAALNHVPGLEGVMLAKTESGMQVDATADRLPAGTKVLALVESAMGLEAAPEIARAEATFRLAFGSGDFRRDTGMDDSPLAMAYPRARLTIASRAARIAAPIDGPTLGSDVEALVRASALTLSMGMTGKLCMTIAQTASVNDALSPSPAEAEWAMDVIADLGEDGSRVRDGSDLPKLAKAKKIHALAKLFHIAPRR